MRADGREFPVELVVTRPEACPAPRRGDLLRLPARPDRALRGRDRRCTGSPTSRPRCGAWRRRSRPSTSPRGCSRWSARRSGGCWRRGRRTCSASTPTARRARSSAAGRCGRDHVLPVGTRMPLDGDTAATRVWRTGRPARMDSYDQAEGELAATLRGYGVQAVVAAPVFLGGSLWGAVIVSTMDPRAVPGGRRAADLLLRRARRAGAGQRPGARGAGRLARPHRRRRRRRAPAAGAQPARRRAAAARVAGADAAARRPPAPGRPRPRRWRARSSRTRCRSCASSPAASTPRCSPSAASSPRCARSPTARRCRSSSPSASTERLPGPVEAAAYYVVSEALTNVAKYAGRQRRPRPHRARRRRRPHRRVRRRRGRRRPRRRLRPARPRRPRRGPRRPPHDRLPARRGHHPPRRHPTT